MNLILGGPGCGKTTHLMGVVDDELASGVQPHQLAFVSFTRKAASEARERAAKRFSFKLSDIPHFKTLHAFCFRQLQLGLNDVMSKQDYKTVGESLGLDLDGYYDEESSCAVPDKKGSQIVYLEQLHRLTMRPLKEVCSAYKTQSYFDVLRYKESLAEFKRSRRVIDYTDMLEMFVNGHGEVPKLKVVIVDEAQDLSPLQWKVVDRLCKDAERVYVAGDDDQAIYEWSGADIKRFLSLSIAPHVLPTSHRLPRAIFNKANQISSRIKNRYEKYWNPASEGGVIRYYNEASDVDFSEGSWYLLARNRYLLSGIVRELRQLGYPYIQFDKSSISNETVQSIVSWERLRKGDFLPYSDIKTMYNRMRVGGVKKNALQSAEVDKFYCLADLQSKYTLTISPTEDWRSAIRMPDVDMEYYRNIRRKGESLLKQPRIVVSTIHQVKGGEADHVLLSSDMSFACHEELTRNSDAENRVFYVGVSRAKKSLHILHPQTARFYNL